MSGVPIFKIDKPFISPHGNLSECPLYDPRDNTLAWVDIFAHKVYRAQLSFATSAEHEQAPIVKCFEVADSVGCIGLTDQVGRYIAGCQFGLAYLDLNSISPHLSQEYIKRLDKHVTGFDLGDKTGIKLRINDGMVTPDGSFYFGSLSDFDTEEKYGQQPWGTLYRLDNHSEVNNIKTVLDGLTIPNSLGFHPKDPSVVYFTNSTTATISKYHYDAKTKSFSNPEVFFDIKEYYKSRPGSDSSELPDGFVITADGSLWTAVFGGGSVLRIDLETAKVIEEYQFPAKRITCPTFGGIHGDEMFVTTASLDMTGKGGPIGEDRGGDIFRVKITSSKDNFYQGCSKRFIFQTK